jgi:N-glycosylase/DNA lyase
MHDFATPNRQRHSRCGSLLDVTPAPDFDLEKTFNSGQVFHWTPYQNGFVGALGETPVYVEQEGDTIRMSKGQASRVGSYLALDHPLSQIIQTFPTDPAMTAAVEFCHGLRIIRQPAWECLATFLTSALKQVQHIRSISLAIRKRFGQCLRAERTEMFSYPSAELIARVSLAELLDCKLGFRASNLIATAKIVASGEVDLESLHDLSTEEARCVLCTLPGVGEKIANCVLLFAYERLDAVPIDVWISRVLREVYFAGRTKLPPRDLRAFVVQYFGSYAGYAQQYLFHHWRLTYRKKR